MLLAFLRLHAHFAGDFLGDVHNIFGMAVRVRVFCVHRYGQRLDGANVVFLHVVVQFGIGKRNSRLAYDARQERELLVFVGKVLHRPEEKPAIIECLSHHRNAYA